MMLRGFYSLTLVSTMVEAWLFSISSKIMHLKRYFDQCTIKSASIFSQGSYFGPCE
jgi:hypothetical protein